MNLIIIVVAWCASTVCFYIIGFYIKYIPGDVFSNIIITSIADALSSIGAGVISTHFGAKNTLFFSFTLAALSGIALLLAESGKLWGEGPLQIMVFVLVTRYGINSAFTLCYIITADYFASIISSQVFGICNVFARFSTILAPLIAEINKPVPMIVYILICFISMLSSLFLTKSEIVEDAFKEIDDSLSHHSHSQFGL